MSIKKDVKSILNVAKNVTRSGKSMLNMTKANVEIKKLQIRQNEHKVSIGKIICEKGLQVEDSLIKSNIKAIQGLLE